MTPRTNRTQNEALRFDNDQRDFDNDSSFNTKHNAVRDNASVASLLCIRTAIYCHHVETLGR